MSGYRFGAKTDNDNGDMLTNGVIYYYTAFAHNATSYTQSGGVRALAAPTFVAEGLGLVGYYPFNKGTDDADYMEDGSGLANHGTYLTNADSTGDMTYSDGDAASGAYSFNGSSDYMEIDNPLQIDSSPDQETGDFTLSTWIRLPAPEIEIIIDNANGSPTFTTQGNWGNRTSGSGYYKTNYKRESSGNSRDIWAKWTPVISVPGYYRFYMWWATNSDNKPDAAPLEIVYNGGTDTLKTVNQRQNGGKWIYIGTYLMASGNSNYIKIIAKDGGKTMADAVKFVFSGYEDKGEEVANWYDGLSLIDGKIGEDQNDFGLTYSAGKALFGTGGGPGNEATIKTSGMINDGDWYNLTATRLKSGGKIKLYVNGVLNASADDVLPDVDLNTPSLLKTGGRIYSEDHFFAGELDEIRLYDTALDATGDISNIQKLWSGPLGLIGYYSFEDADSGTSLDYSGNENHGTVNKPSSTTGYVGSMAYKFIYNDQDYIQYDININPNSGSDPKPNLTLTFWFKPTTQRETQYIFTNRTSSIRGRGLFLYKSGGNIYYRLYYSGSNHTIADTTAFSMDIWEHIAVVYDNSSGTNKIYFYRNGEEKTGGTIIETYSSANIYFRLGNSSTSVLDNGTEGSIDDFKVYKRALSATEILSLYNQ